MNESRLRISLLAILFLAAIPFGCIEDWSRWLLVTLLGLAFCWFLKAGIPIVLGRRERIAIGLGCAYLAWLGFQMLPMPPGALARVSPAAHRIYQVAVPGYASSDPEGYAYLDPIGSAASWITPAFSTARALSLNPYGTYRNLFQTAALIGFVIMGSSLFRRQRHKQWLAGSLVGLATFEALYGSLESLTGHQHIFWYAKHYYRDVATGTLVNRNHYAAMLNLVLPLSVALLLDRRPLSPVPLRFLPVRMRLKQIAGACREPFLLSVSIVIGIAIVLSRSRMGIAAMVSGLVSLSVLLGWQIRSKAPSLLAAGEPAGARRMWALPLLLVLGIGLYSLGTDVLPTMHRLSLIPNDLQAGSFRPALWAESMPVIREYLWAGAGSGAFPYALNPALTGLPLGDFWDWDHAHNDYVETAATLGIAGSLLGVAALALFCIRRPGSLLGLAAMAGLATLVVHSAADFLLVIPSNALIACALLCLIAGPDDRASRAPRGGWRLAACLLTMGLVILWPGRSLLAAAVFRPHWNSSPDRPEVVRALRNASALEPWNDFYARKLGQGILGQAAYRPSGEVVLGDGVQRQALRLRLEVLGSLVAGQKELLRSLDLSPVDYSLHAEIAKAASDIRTLARECGIAAAEDRQARFGLASPHLASVALAPTAYGSQVAMAALLWKSRHELGEPSASTALDLMSRALKQPGFDPRWKTYLVRITDDGPSLARLDQALQPPPVAYARLVRAAINQAAPPDLSGCVAALEARARLREARGAIEPLLDAQSGSRAVLGKADQDRLRKARVTLQSVIAGARAASPLLGENAGACGDTRLRMEDLGEEAVRLLAAAESCLKGGS